MGLERPAKVGIVGAGSVGATIAYAAMIRGVARQISLYDITRTKVEAEVLDLNHGQLFAPEATVDGSDDIEVLRGSDVVVVTAGARQKPGQTRLDLAAANARILEKLLPDVVRSRQRPSCFWSPIPSTSSPNSRSSSLVCLGSASSVRHRP